MLKNPKLGIDKTYNICYNDVVKQQTNHQTKEITIMSQDISFEMQLLDSEVAWHDRVRQVQQTVARSRAGSKAHQTATQELAQLMTEAPRRLSAEHVSTIKAVRAQSEPGAGLQFEKVALDNVRRYLGTSRSTTALAAFSQCAESYGMSYAIATYSEKVVAEEEKNRGIDALLILLETAVTPDDAKAIVENWKLRFVNQIMRWYPSRSTNPYHNAVEDDQARAIRALVETADSVLATMDYYLSARATWMRRVLWAKTTDQS